MRILIVEDERRIAKLLERLIREIWGGQLSRLHHCRSLGEANNFLSQHPIDLLFLDLNLKNENGFELLRQFTSRAFQVVVVSAYRERAIEAFEYGVLDFIPKPFGRARLQKTYDRLFAQSATNQPAIKYIAIKKAGSILPIPISKICYIQADGHYTQIHLTNGHKEISDQPLEKLQLLLPIDFVRSHRSYLVHLLEVLEIKKYPGSKADLILKNGTILPIGRSRLKEVEGRMI